MANMRQELKRLGLTQEALAAEAGIKGPALSRKLNGKRPWFQHEINAVIECLRKRDPGVTYEQLFGQAA